MVVEEAEAVRRRGHVDALGDDVGGERELDLADVADRDRVRAARRLDHRAERAELAILDVHTHLARRVVGAVPELDVGVERAALGAEDDLNLLDGRGAVRPRAEGAALHKDRGVNIPPNSRDARPACATCRPARPASARCRRRTASLEPPCASQTTCRPPTRRTTGPRRSERA